MSTQSLAIRSDDALGPFADNALCDSGQCLARAARDQRDDGALMRGVARTALERFPELFSELAIGAQRRVKLAVDFTHDAIAGARADGIGQ